MRNTLAIILLSIISTFAQERVVDTIYTDTHKVTYVTNQPYTNAQDIKSNDSTSQPNVPKDTFGLSAPPDKFNKISILLIAQNLNFTLN